MQTQRGKDMSKHLRILQWCLRRADVHVGLFNEVFRQRKSAETSSYQPSVRNSQLLMQLQQFFQVSKHSVTGVKHIFLLPTTLMSKEILNFSTLNATIRNLNFSTLNATIRSTDFATGVGERLTE